MKRRKGAQKHHLLNKIRFRCLVLLAAYKASTLQVTENEKIAHASSGISKAAKYK